MGLTVRDKLGPTMKNAKSLLDFDWKCRMESSNYLENWVRIGGVSLEWVIAEKCPACPEDVQ